MEVEYLQEMLEGQVAVLSADLLSFDEVEKLLAALENSKMYILVAPIIRVKARLWIIGFMVK